MVTISSINSSEAPSHQNRADAALSRPSFAGRNARRQFNGISGVTPVANYTRATTSSSSPPKEFLRKRPLAGDGNSGSSALDAGNCDSVRWSSRPRVEPQNTGSSIVAAFNQSSRALEETSKAPKPCIVSPKLNGLKLATKPQRATSNGNFGFESGSGSDSDEKNTGSVDECRLETVEKEITIVATSPRRPSTISLDRGRTAQRVYSRGLGSTKQVMSISGPAQCINGISDDADENEMVVVGDTRDAHTSREAGRSQQVADDIEYLLDGLLPEKHSTERAQSALKLAKLALSSDFRTFLWTKGVLPRVFVMFNEAVHDEASVGPTALAMLALLRDHRGAALDPRAISVLVKVSDNTCTMK